MVDVSNPLLYKMLISSSDNLRNDLIRWCMSDRVAHPLAYVVNQEHDIIYYATQRLEHDYEALNKRFPLPYQPVQKVTYDFNTMRLYDGLIHAGATVRATELFPDDLPKVRELVSLARLYSLTINDSSLPLSYIGGLTSYGKALTDFVQDHRDIHKEPEFGYVEMVAKSVSSIDKPDWLLWDNRWQHLVHKKRSLTTLRYFFYTLFACFVTDPRLVEHFFGMDKEDIMVYAYEFLEMRSNPHLTKKDVDLFVERLGYHFVEEVNNTRMSVLLQAPFQLTNIFFKDCDEDNQRFVNVMTSSHTNFVTM